MVDLSSPSRVIWILAFSVRAILLLFPIEWGYPEVTQKISRELAAELMAVGNQTRQIGIRIGAIHLVWCKLDPSHSSRWVLDFLVD